AKPGVLLELRLAPRAVEEILDQQSQLPRRPAQTDLCGKDIEALGGVQPRGIRRTLADGAQAYRAVHTARMPRRDARGDHPRGCQRDGVAVACVVAVGGVDQ